jgi:hypothetical protein
MREKQGKLRDLSWKWMSRLKLTRQNNMVCQHDAGGMRKRSECLCNGNSDMMCAVRRIAKTIND